MAIVATNLDHGETTGVSATTASITPTANALIIVSTSDFTGINNFPTSVVGNGITYTQLTTVGDSGNSHTMAMYYGMSAAPTTGGITITYAASTGRITWSVDQFTGVNTSGINGSGAIVQSATSNTLSGSTNTGQTVTLAALGSPNNVAYGYVFCTGITTPATLIAGSAFTELCNQVNDGTLESEYAINQTVVNWTWASQPANYNNAIAIEIAAAPGVVTGTPFISEWLFR